MNILAIFYTLLIGAVACLLVFWFATLATLISSLKATDAMARTDDETASSLGRSAKVTVTVGLALWPVLPLVSLILGKVAALTTDHDRLEAKSQPNPVYEDLGPETRTEIRRAGEALPPSTLKTRLEPTWPDVSRQGSFITATISAAAAACLAIALVILSMSAATQLTSSLTRGPLESSSAQTLEDGLSDVDIDELLGSLDVEENIGADSAQAETGAQEEGGEDTETLNIQEQETTP